MFRHLPVFLTLLALCIWMRASLAAQVPAPGDIPDTAAINLLNHLSDSSIAVESTDSALAWSTRALKMAQRIDYDAGEARAFYMRGKIYLYNNVFPLAAEDFLRAQTLYRNIGDNAGMADCALQTGVLMYTQKNFNEALAAFREAVPLYRKSGNIGRYAVNQYLAGLSLYELGGYGESLQELQQALKTQDSLGNTWKTMECRIAIANVYHKTGRNTEALDLFRTCLQHFDSVNAPEGQTLSHTGMGTVLAALHRDAEAEQHFMAAFEISRNIKHEWLNTQVIGPIYRYYESKGDYKKAFEFQKLFLQYRDSVLSEKNMQSMAQMKAYLDLTRKQNEIDALSRQEKFQARVRWSLVIILALLVAVLAGLYRRYLYRKRLNEVLAAKNRELDTTLRHLKTAEQQLIKAEKMAVFGKLSAGIAHEIRNPLNFITNFSDLSLQAAEDFIASKDDSERADSADQLKKLLDKIGYHGRRADSIVTRMLQHSRSAHTEMELTDLNRLAGEFSDLAYESMRNLVTNFECRLEKDLAASLPRVHLVPQDMSRVIINLLNNAFYAVHEKKHHHESGYIPCVRVKTYASDGQVFLSIADNGSGIPEAVREKIFEPFFTTKPMGEGTGLGLAICADIVKASRGQIAVQSSPRQGTEFRVSFPLVPALSAT